MGERIDRLRMIIKEKGLDAVLLFKPENRRYVSGFTGSTGYALITRNDAKFITDFRYLQQAALQCIEFDVVEINNQKSITDVLNQLSLKKIGVEEDFMTYGQYRDYSIKLNETELVPLDGVITDLRSIKSNDEIEHLEKAALIADEAFIHILEFIKPGMSELEVALELEYFMKKKGASSLSFESIVASGKRSSLPHGVASDKIIEIGDIITLDFGCVYNGYCSDMTRTFVLGKANEKQKKIYDVVLEAQLKSMEAVKPGITGEELDTIARNIIIEHGYGEYFGHGLGHGVGLEVHELPRINSLSKTKMVPGMIITIEPGVYIPDFGGVRIEDLVLVTENGYKVLSYSTKGLIELNI